MEIGTQTPLFTLQNLNGQSISLENLLAIKKPIILVFSDPSCDPSAAMMPSLMQWENEFKLEVMLVLISRGTNKQNIDKMGEIHLDEVFLQADREVSEQ